MAVTIDGVKFINKPKRGLIFLMILGLVEFLLTAFLVVSLSANILFPEKTRAVQGISDILSYQGRLTNASDSPLTGSYCMRFSIWDAGAKLWPSGDPTSNTVSVSNGVFNVGIGEADDLSVFNFYSNDTVYLNVEVYTTVSPCTGGSWEALSPRQRIDAVGYSRSAYNLYGGDVRIGLGSGTSSPKLLYLDVKNVADTIGGSCTTSGTLWYNSSNTRALVCDNGTIQEIGNLGTIVGIKEQSAGSAITSGTVNFSASENITIVQEGQTLKFKGPAGGGGGGATLSDFRPQENIFSTIGTIPQGSCSIRPVLIPFNVTATAMRFAVSQTVATQSNNSSAGQNISINVAIYTLNGSSLSRASSGSAMIYASYSSNATGSVTGMKQLTVPINLNIAPGEYWIGVAVSTATSGQTSLAQTRTLYGNDRIPTAARAINIGNIGQGTATIRHAFPFQGIYTAATSACPASISSGQMNITSASNPVRANFWFEMRSNQPW